jgi:hypothetical protein
MRGAIIGRAMVERNTKELLSPSGNAVELA